MNSVQLIGRLSRDPDVRYGGGNQSAIARFTVAVDRSMPDKNGNRTADFISCVAFGKSAEFIEKYFQKGKPIALTGRIQTGSYTNKDGQTVYTTDVIVDRVEFVPGDKGSGDGSSSRGNFGGNDSFGGNSRGGSFGNTDEPFINSHEGFTDLGDDDIPF